MCRRFWNYIRAAIILEGVGAIWLTKKIRTLGNRLLELEFMILKSSVSLHFVKIQQNFPVRFKWWPFWSPNATSGISCRRRSPNRDQHLRIVPRKHGLVEEKVNKETLWAQSERRKKDLVCDLQILWHFASLRNCFVIRFGSENKLKWELITDVGDITFVSPNSATTGSFSDLEKSAMSVLSRMDSMVAEMDYEQTFENRLKNNILQLV